MSRQGSRVSIRPRPAILRVYGVLLAIVVVGVVWRIIQGTTWWPLLLALGAAFSLGLGAVLSSKIAFDGEEMYRDAKLAF